MRPQFLLSDPQEYSSLIHVSNPTLTKLFFNLLIQTGGWHLKFSTQMSNTSLSSPKHSNLLLGTNIINHTLEITSWVIVIALCQYKLPRWNQTQPSLISYEKSAVCLWVSFQGFQSNSKQSILRITLPITKIWSSGNKVNRSLSYQRRLLLLRLCCHQVRQQVTLLSAGENSLFIHWLANWQEQNILIARVES